MRRTEQSVAVLYDDHCAFCQAQVTLLRRLDWFTTLKFVPMSDTSKVARFAPRLTATDLQQAMHCVSHSGRIYRAARAVRHIGMRIPLLFPLALLMWVPGIIHLAEVLYARVAKNRYVLSRFFGCENSCLVAR